MSFMMYFVIVCDELILSKLCHVEKEKNDKKVRAVITVQKYEKFCRQCLRTKRGRL